LVCLKSQRKNKERNKQRTTMVKIPNPFEIVATGVRVATGVGLDVVSQGVEKVFPSVGDHSPETTCQKTLAAGGTNLYEDADTMLDRK
jgi:hypothetical protein